MKRTLRRADEAVDRIPSVASLTMSFVARLRWPMFNRKGDMAPKGTDAWDEGD
jgi:hypothetical protein